MNIRLWDNTQLSSLAKNLYPEIARAMHKTHGLAIVFAGNPNTVASVDTLVGYPVEQDYDLPEDVLEVRGYWPRHLGQIVKYRKTISLESE